MTPERKLPLETFTQSYTLELNSRANCSTAIRNRLADHRARQNDSWKAARRWGLAGRTAKGRNRSPVDQNGRTNSILPNSSASPIELTAEMSSLTAHRDAAGRRPSLNVPTSPPFSLGFISSITAVPLGPSIFLIRRMICVQMHSQSVPLFCPSSSLWSPLPNARRSR